MFGGKDRPDRAGPGLSRGPRMLRMGPPPEEEVQRSPETGEDLEAAAGVSSDQTTRSGWVEPQKCSAGSDLSLGISSHIPAACRFTFTTRLRPHPLDNQSGGAETQQQVRGRQQTSFRTATSHSRIFLESESAPSAGASRCWAGAVSLGTPPYLQLR